MSAAGIRFESDSTTCVRRAQGKRRLLSFFGSMSASINPSRQTPEPIVQSPWTPARGGGLFHRPVEARLRIKGREVGGWGGVGLNPVGINWRNALFLFAQ